MTLERNTSGADEVFRRIIKRDDGGVIVRIGSKEEKTSPPTVVKYAHAEENGEIEAARQQQMARNAAYRESTTRQYIEKNDSSSSNSHSLADNSVDSGHTYYTKVSSSKQKTGSPSSETQFIITRKLTKGRISPKSYDGVDVMHVTENLTNGANTNGRQGHVENFDYFDALARKKLDYKEDGSLKYFPKETCFCCRKTVYQKEKIGPIRGVLFHKQCFRCCVCGFVLNLTNFHHNSNDLEDRGLYCKSHEPVAKSATVNIKDQSIQAIINKPKVEQLNPNIRGGQAAIRGLSHQTEGIYIQSPSKVDVNNINSKVNHNSQVTQQVTVNQPATRENGDKSVEPPKMYHNTVTVKSNGGVGVNAQNGNANDLYHVSMRTAVNAPKIAVYNPTVRPVPAMAKTVPVQDVYISPIEYTTRQVPGPTFTQTPTPPSSPQHVHFDGNTKTYYYISKT